MERSAALFDVVHTLVSSTAGRSEGRGGCEDTVGTHRQTIREGGDRLKLCVEE
jgi:hypothetical protein